MKAKQDCLSSATCPICLKRFVPAPQNVYVMLHTDLCSWSCLCEARRRKEFKTEEKHDGEGIAERIEELQHRYPFPAEWVQIRLGISHETYRRMMQRNTRIPKEIFAKVDKYLGTD